MRKHLTGFVIAAALVALAVPSVLSEAHGADRARSPSVARPAPANVPFGELRTIYVGSGVTDSGGAINTGVATSFHCTNVSGVVARLRILVLDFDGAIVANSIRDLLHTRTLTASTHGTVLSNEDVFLSTGAVIDQGVVNIESDQSAVFCTAMIVDASASVPIGNALHLTRVNPDPGTENQPASSRVAPSNIPFGELRTIYVASGLTDNNAADDTGRATSFLCSNVSGVTAKLRYLVLQFNGAIEADATFDLPHAQTHTASTHSTIAFREDADLSTGLLDQGVVAIEADQSAVFCSAMRLDASAATPAGIALHLTRINVDPGTLN